MMFQQPAAAHMSKYQWTNDDLIGGVCKILYGDPGDLPSLARDLKVDLRWVQRWQSPTGKADPLPHHMRQMLCLVLENLPDEDG